MHAQLVGYDFKKKGLPTDKNIAVENSKVSNDYFWKTNEYTDKDVFGRTLDLTALINKPDGYLKGSLSDTQDVDYYKFNITEYRALSFAKDTYNKDITITLDHIPEGCNYEMVLYDEEGNQVGIGKDNGNGGLSITIPNWNTDNRGYTVKVQAKNGSMVNPDAEYHLSFQTTQADKSHGAYQEMAEVQKYAGTVRKQMQEGLTDTEEMRAIKEIRQKYKAYYTEQMEKLHQEQAEEVMQGGAVPDDEQIQNLLEKKAAGKELTEQENVYRAAAERRGDRERFEIAEPAEFIKQRIERNLQNRSGNHYRGKHARKNELPALPVEPCERIRAKRSGKRNEDHIEHDHFERVENIQKIIVFGKNLSVIVKRELRRDYSRGVYVHLRHKRTHDKQKKREREKNRDERENEILRDFDENVMKFRVAEFFVCDVFHNLSLLSVKHPFGLFEHEKR